jgi:hypothetical protein
LEKQDKGSGGDAATKNMKSAAVTYIAIKVFIRVVLPDISEPLRPARGRMVFFRTLRGVHFLPNSLPTIKMDTGLVHFSCMTIF